MNRRKLLAWVGLAPAAVIVPTLTTAAADRIAFSSLEELALVAADFILEAIELPNGDIVHRETRRIRRGPPPPAAAIA